MKNRCCFSFLLFAVLCSGAISAPAAEIDPDTNVVDVLMDLGEPRPPHLIDWPDYPAYVEKGRELFYQGRTTDFDGNLTPIQSRYFRCIDCHATTREDPDLAVSSAEDRAEFAAGRGMPFLPGTTLFGTVNKSSWYNGYYAEHYGELVREARHDLMKAIQVCSTACSSGRRLQRWEQEAVMAFLWSRQYKLRDLNLNKQERDQVADALAGAGSAPEAVQLVRSKYRDHSPATFSAPPADLQSGYPLTGDPNRGRFIYTESCLYCHGSRAGAPMRDTLDTDWSSYSYLMDEITGPYSFYLMIRHGTQSNGAYMPLYPMERMTDQQVEDLRAFIEGELWMGVR